ncbi:unnamed protein product, partial [Didymodactylos carnosus]
QSNVFFTTKNFLVVLLQLYRVCVIVIEHRKRRQLARIAGLNPDHPALNELLTLPITPINKKIMKLSKKKGSTMSNSSLNMISNGKLSQSTSMPTMHRRLPITVPLPRKKRPLSSMITTNIQPVSRSKHSMRHSSTLPVNNNNNNNNTSSSYTEI